MDSCDSRSRSMLYIMMDSGPDYIQVSVEVRP